MAKYKLQTDGVLDTERNAFIPDNPANKDWAEYQEWLALGNIPDPQYTQEELDLIAYNERQDARIIQLRNAIITEFEMILAIYQVGRDKGLWLATDFPQEIRDKAAQWIQLINDYKNDTP